MTSSAEVMECQVTVGDSCESDDVVGSHLYIPVQVQRRHWVCHNKSPSLLQVAEELPGLERKKGNEIIRRC